VGRAGIEPANTWIFSPSRLCADRLELPVDSRVRIDSTMKFHNAYAPCGAPALNRYAPLARGATPLKRNAAGTSQPQED